MTSTTKTRTKALIAAPLKARKARIAAPLDLNETYGEPVAPMIEQLAARDDVIVDLWSDDLPALAFLGEEALVEIHGDVDSVIDAVARRLRMGWGREGDLLDGMDVERLDGRTPLEADVTALTIFRPKVAGRTATWRLVESTIGEPVAR